MKDSKVSKKKVRKSAGAEIIEGLSEFRDAIKGGEKIEGRFTVRTVELDLQPLLPKEYGPEDVKATRNRLCVSQAIFAQLLGISLKLVQAWEQGKRVPEMLARHVLDDINRNPDRWRDRLDKAARSKPQHQHA
jgi:putative transcriptional regulator